MKQTKKLTRSQRELLHKKGVDTKECRLVEDTKEYIVVQFSDGSIFRYYKEV